MLMLCTRIFAAKEHASFLVDGGNIMREENTTEMLEKSKQ